MKVFVCASWFFSSRWIFCSNIQICVKNKFCWLQLHWNKIGFFHSVNNLLTENIVLPIFLRYPCIDEHMVCNITGIQGYSTLLLFTRRIVNNGFSHATIKCGVYSNECACSAPSNRSFAQKHRLTHAHKALSFEHADISWLDILLRCVRVIPVV